MKDISDKPFAGFVDIHYLLGSMGNGYMDSTEKMMMDASVNMWDKMIMYGGEFKSGGLQTHTEIRLMDKTTNSMKQLNNYVGVMGAAMQKKSKHREMQDAQTDTIPQIAPVEQH